MKTIRFVVLEDDPKFLSELTQELNMLEDCEVVGSSDNVLGGYEEIIRSHPDALILDIELFGGSAFDLVRLLHQNQIEIPPIVIITANVAFEVASEALDVCGTSLVKLIGKPFWKNWKEEFPAIKASILARLKNSERQEDDGEVTFSTNKEAIFVRSSQITHRIIVQDIIYLEVDGEGQTNIIMSDQRRILVRKTLNMLLQVLPPQIMRINRFNAINVNKLLHVNHEDDTLMIDGHIKPLTIGETYKEKLREMMS